MPFSGRHQLGNLLPLSVRCVDGNGTPTLPATAPMARIFDDDGLLVTTQKLPLTDSPDTTALFSFPFTLGSEFTTGLHTVLYDYAVSGTHRSVEDHFQIVPGGDADGNGISMYYMRQPSRDFVLVQTDSGLLRRLRNPRLT